MSIFSNGIGEEKDKKGNKVKFNLLREVLSGKNITHQEKEPEWFKYFDYIGNDEREIVKKWYLRTSPSDYSQLKFLKLVKEAIENIDYDFRIANMEPSKSIENKIYYEEGKEVCTGYSYCQWKKMAWDFSPEYGSKLANLFELFLYYAYRVAIGSLSINEVCNDSSNLGNYKDSITATHKLEVAGKRAIRDGIGNTSKIIGGEYLKYVVVGGNYESEGKRISMSYTSWSDECDKPIQNACGVIVLKK